MQPSSGTMREVRQCGMISPRQSGRMSWVAWKKRFWKSRCSFIFFYFLNLCKKNFKQLNLKKIQTNFDAGPASPPCFYSEIIKSIFKCFSEVDISERNRASWFCGRIKGTQPYPASGYTHMDDTDHRKMSLRVSRAGATVTPTHIQTEPDLAMAKTGLMYASLLRVCVHGVHHDLYIYRTKYI